MPVRLKGFEPLREPSEDCVLPLNYRRIDDTSRAALCIYLPTAQFGRTGIIYLVIASNASHGAYLRGVCVQEDFSLCRVRLRTCGGPARAVPCSREEASDSV